MIGQRGLNSAGMRTGVISRMMSPAIDNTGKRRMLISVEEGGDRLFWLYEEWVRVTGVCKRERWNECAFLVRVRVRVLSSLSRV